jgi:hypothetical protein
MSQAKVQNVNCQCFRNGNCLHSALPRKWFGAHPCLLLPHDSNPLIVPSCALQYPYARPDGFPLPTPGRLLTIGRKGERLEPPDFDLIERN